MLVDVRDDRRHLLGLDIAEIDDTLRNQRLQFDDQGGQHQLHGPVAPDGGAFDQPLLDEHLDQIRRHGMALEIEDDEVVMQGGGVAHVDDELGDDIERLGDHGEHGGDVRVLLDEDVHQDIVLIGIGDPVRHRLVEHDQAALVQLDQLVVDVLRAPPGIHVVHLDEAVGVLRHVGKTVALGDGDAAVLEEDPLRHPRHGIPGEIQVHVIEVADRAELAAFNIVVLMQDAIKPL